MVNRWEHALGGKTLLRSELRTVLKELQWFARSRWRTHAQRDAALVWGMVGAVRAVRGSCADPCGQRCHALRTSSTLVRERTGDLSERRSMQVRQRHLDTRGALHSVCITEPAGSTEKSVDSLFGSARDCNAPHSSNHARSILKRFLRWTARSWPVCRLPLPPYEPVLVCPARSACHSSRKIDMSTKSVYAPSIHTTWRGRPSSTNPHAR
jgi:hypothetical protein